MYSFLAKNVFMCRKNESVPEFLIEGEGVVHAELWQRPAEICLTFLSLSSVISVGSFTGFECPRPS